MISRLYAILQLDVEEHERLSGGDIPILGLAPYRIGKGLGDDTCHVLLSTDASLSFRGLKGRGSN